MPSYTLLIIQLSHVMSHLLCFYLISFNDLFLDDLINQHLCDIFPVKQQMLHDNLKKLDVFTTVGFI